jgi:hypothetical protein
VVVEGQRSIVAPHRPRHVQQVEDAGVTNAVEGHGARVEQRRETGDRGEHVRHDAERAAEGGDQARPGSARQTRSERVQDAGPRRKDDYQRGGEEFGAHLPSVADGEQVLAVDAEVPGPIGPDQRAGAAVTASGPEIVIRHS